MNAPDLTITKPLGRRGRSTSPERQAVEEVLKAARGQPLTADTVASRSGLRADEVRVIIRNCCTKGLAHNVAPGEPLGQYLWGQPTLARPPAGTATARGQQRPMKGDDTYRGEALRPFTGRPGAMHAFTLPSLVNGTRSARVRPVLISAQPVRQP